MAEAAARGERPRGRAYAALAGLEARRVLAGALAPVVLGAVLLALHATVAGPVEAGASALRGLRREAAWTAALLFVAPALVLRAAGTLARWRRGEGDWLGSRPTGRTAALGASWLGAWAAGLALLGAVAVGVELFVGASPSTLAYAGRHAAAPRRIAPGAAAVFAIEGAGRGARARIAVGAALGSDADVRARISARAGDGTAAASTPVAVLGRTWLELELPEGGPLEIAVENLGPGPLALLPGGLEVWRAGGGEGRASLALLARGALLLAAGLALAQGLGAFVSSGTAAAAVLALWIAAVGAGPHWLPGARLDRALGFVGEGRLPEPLGWASAVAAAGVVALGLALGRAGLRSWRPGG